MEDFYFYQLCLELAKNCFKLEIPFEFDFKINGAHNRFAINPDKPNSFVFRDQIVLYQTWETQVINDQIESMKEFFAEKMKKQNTYQGEA